MSKRNPDIDFKKDSRTKILKDVMMDIIHQVSWMEDEDIMEDRSEWMKTVGHTEEKDGLIVKKKEISERLKYNSHIHTLALEIEQLYRFNKIIYDVDIEENE